eukprot:6946992-Pyramimonas_sp.AAC.1
MPAEATLPPRSATQACEFLAISRSGKTASNYIGYVKWTCVHLNLDVSWYGTAVRQTLACLLYTSDAADDTPCVDL